MKGIKRFRQAIKNQRDLGNGDFSLTYHDADGIATEIEDELESLSWAASVPAPKDADGEVVPLTTKVMYGDDGREQEIIFFKFNIDNYATQWSAFCKNKDGNIGYAAVSNIHLRRPDSWERLEEDVNLGCRDYCERYRLEECEYNVRVHMLERAKALAERGAKEAGRG